ncbi:twin-arginine translocase subunit TatC [Alkaliphilus transvaalensis]|uniref:twin-arginine translocase subunit TatC n=1 Tax=Alkaliphilus transvaalensis TaxID=114628 RepID=UPI00047D302F|nr:twin-arginine translocase subunit TatC [Alkaliphilus transvaalensis]
MDEKRLTLVEHLEELRKRIIMIGIVIILGTALSYFFIDRIVEFIIQPAGTLNFIYLSPADLFIAYIKIAVVVGVVITLPIILYHIWRFILPSMDPKQRVQVLVVNFLSMVFFLLGAAFAYYVITPLTLEFFVKMSREQIEPLFSFSSYMGFVGSLLLSFGVTFQLPNLVMLLTKFNIVTPKLLKKSRKFIMLGIFVLAAFLTPPDIISQTLLAVPMLLLLELSIIISTIIYNKKQS